MARTVIPIISKIVGEKGQQPSPPLIADVEEHEAVKEGKDGELHHFGYGVDEDIADAHGDIGGRIFDFIEVTPHESIGDHLQSQKDQESWDSEINKVRHLRCSSPERVERQPGSRHTVHASF